MKTISIITVVILFATVVQAKTYTIGSGRWSDPLVWRNQYIGSTIKAGDVVIITGQITLNTSLVVEGTLQIERGAAMVGMKDLTIAKSGMFVNDGNTVLRGIVNEGIISNHLMMEAMTNIENRGTIENNNNMVAGNNLESNGGNAHGKGGRFYANNTVSNSAVTDFGGVNVFSANEIENKGTAPLVH